MTKLTEQQVEVLAKGLRLTEDYDRVWYEDEWTETRANMHSITTLVNRALEQQMVELERYVHTRVVPILAVCIDHPSGPLVGDVIDTLMLMTLTNVKQDDKQP